MACWYVEHFHSFPTTVHLEAAQWMVNPTLKLRNIQTLYMKLYKKLRPGEIGRYFANNIVKCISVKKWLKFHWSSNQRVQLTISQRWSVWCLDAEHTTRRDPNRWWLSSPTSICVSRPHRDRMDGANMVYFVCWSCYPFNSFFHSWNISCFAVHLTINHTYNKLLKF